MLLLGWEDGRFLPEHMSVWPAGLSPFKTVCRTTDTCSVALQPGPDAEFASRGPPFVTSYIYCCFLDAGHLSSCFLLCFHCLRWIIENINSIPCPVFRVKALNYGDNFRFHMGHLFAHIKLDEEYIISPWIHEIHYLLHQTWISTGLVWKSVHKLGFIAFANTIIFSLFCDKIVKNVNSRNCKKISSDLESKNILRPMLIYLHVCDNN